MITVLIREEHQFRAEQVPRRVPLQGPRPGGRGRPVAQVAADLDIGDRTIYVWRRQELIDTA